MASSPKIHRGFLVLIACCAICFSTVTLSFNTMGIFYTPAGTDLGIEVGRFGTYMSVQYLSMAICMFFAGKILAKYDARWVLTICCTMVCVGITLMSTYNYIWQFYISGVLIGAANTVLLYLMVPTMIDRWFRDRVGFFVGLALAFTGFGAVVFNPLGGWLIKSFGWRTGYLVFGLISGGIGIPSSIFLVRNKPQDMSLTPWTKRSAEELEAEDAAKAAAAVKGVSFARAIRTPALFLCALHAGMMDVGITLNYYLPSYEMWLGYDVLVTSTIASAVMIGQMVGKIALGFINDIDVRKGVITAVTSGIVGIGLMNFLGAYGIIWLYIGAFFFGVFFAGATVTVSLMTRGVYGSKDFARIFSVVSTVATLSSAFSSAIWGWLIDLTGSYHLTLTIGICVMISIYFIGHAYFKSGEKVKRAAEEEDARLEAEAAAAMAATTAVAGAE